MVASLPDNEAERLDALYALGILDTEPEAEFDDLARLAAFICGTPIAAVTLVDSERQWFKSMMGLETTETPRDVAFCAHAILEPDLMLVPDAREDERFADNKFVTGDPNIRFYAGIPLTSADGHALGALCVIDRVARTLSAEQKDALRTLARQVSHQIRAGRTVRERERLIAEKEALIAERGRTEFALNRSYAALAESAERLRRLTDAAFEGIIISQNNALLDVSPACATLFGYASPDEMVGLPGVGLAAPESRAVVAKAVATCDERPYEALLVRRDGSGFLAELRGRGIHIDGKAARITAVRDISEHRAAEAKIRDYASMLETRTGELEKANALLEALATTDSLTNLCNHRAFQERLAEEIERSRRNATPLSLILLDVDDFKRYNDEHGHPAGDIVLKEVAEILENCSRQVDLVARYGGEEFVFVVPQTDIEGAMVYAERIRAAIEVYSWPLRPVTASFGVASLCRSGGSGTDILERADRALYRSKAAGRNRVMAAAE